MLMHVHHIGCSNFSNCHMHASSYICAMYDPHLIAIVSCRHHHTTAAGEGRDQEAADAAWLPAAASSRA